MKLGLIALVLAGVAACPAPVGSQAPVSPDSTAQCRNYCGHIGLPLESVVIMASNVGCVCDARPPMPAGPPSTTSPTTSSAASSTAGGMAAVMIEQEQEREAQQRQAQRH
jgi:hypothetical protein